MAGRAAKQSYVGRVIYPAMYKQGVNGGKAFLTFTLYVDNLTINPATKKRESGKIGCTYTIYDDNDPVAMILCNIFKKDEPDRGGIGGNQYKSVMVWVEGSEKLTLVVNQDGTPVPGAVYKNLEYCTVQIIDQQVMAFYRAAFGQQGSDDGEADMAPATTALPFQQATVAPHVMQQAAPFVQQPAMAAPTPVQPQFVQQAAPQPQQPQQMPTNNLVRGQQRTTAQRRQYQPGDRLADQQGRILEFVGGDPTNVANWSVVDQAVQPAQVQAAAAPVQQPTQATTLRNTPIREMLDPNNSFAGEGPLTHPKVAL